MINITIGIPEVSLHITVKTCLCRAIRARVCVADSGTPSAATNATADNANNVRQKRPPIAEDVDNGYVFLDKSVLYFICLFLE